MVVPANPDGLSSLSRRKEDKAAPRVLAAAAANSTHSISWTPRGETASTTTARSYQRLDLTILRRVALGDRWAGEIKIAANSIRVATTGSLPGQDMKPKDWEAHRP
jgi:hypothetical protein